MAVIEFQFRIDVLPYCVKMLTISSSLRIKSAYGGPILTINISSRRNSTRISSSAFNKSCMPLQIITSADEIKASFRVDSLEKICTRFRRKEVIYEALVSEPF